MLVWAQNRFQFGHGRLKNWRPRPGRSANKSRRSSHPASARIAPSWSTASRAISITQSVARPRTRPSHRHDLALAVRAGRRNEHALEDGVARVLAEGRRAVRDHTGALVDAKLCDDVGRVWEAARAICDRLDRRRVALPGLQQLGPVDAVAGAAARSRRTGVVPLAARGAVAGILHAGDRGARGRALQLKLVACRIRGPRLLLADAATKRRAERPRDPRRRRGRRRGRRWRRWRRRNSGLLDVGTCMLGRRCAPNQPPKMHYCVTPWSGRMQRRADCAMKGGTPRTRQRRLRWCWMVLSWRGMAGQWGGAGIDRSH